MQNLLSLAVVNVISICKQELDERRSLCKVYSIVVAQTVQHNSSESGTDH